VTRQPDLFATDGIAGQELPDGMRHADGFLDPAAEAGLLEHIRALPLQNAQYLQYTARRRVLSYGGKYDYAHRKLDAAPPMPDWLQPIKDRAAQWAALDPDDIAQALVAEYAPGTPLGWHRDVPDYESIIGISLAGEGTMRFRRYPPVKPGRAELTFILQPRSIYTLQRDARWKWQHAVSPTKVLRYSITFRTRRASQSSADCVPISAVP
jgi:alkylated DNA repair dioxygenase AlkB